MPECRFPCRGPQTPPWGWLGCPASPTAGGLPRRQRHPWHKGRPSSGGAASPSSLHHSFGLRVEGHSGYMLHAVLGTPLSPRDGCELLYPSVRRDDGRHAIAGPPSDQGVHNGHCG